MTFASWPSPHLSGCRHGPQRGLATQRAEALPGDVAGKSLVPGLRCDAGCFQKLAAGRPPCREGGRGLRALSTKSSANYPICRAQDSDVSPWIFQGLATQRGQLG